jgi:hypothetical protein
MNDIRRPWRDDPAAWVKRHKRPTADDLVKRLIDRAHDAGRMEDVSDLGKVRDRIEALEAALRLIATTPNATAGHMCVVAGQALRTHTGGQP